jgi:hypothetical protein
MLVWALKATWQRLFDGVRVGSLAICFGRFICPYYTGPVKWVEKRRIEDF